jgi:hypothetical protein
VSVWCTTIWKMTCSHTSSHHPVDLCWKYYIRKSHPVSIQWAYADMTVYPVRAATRRRAEVSLIQQVARHPLDSTQSQRQEVASSRVDRFLIAPSPKVCRIRRLQQAREADLASGVSCTCSRLGRLGISSLSSLYLRTSNEPALPSAQLMVKVHRLCGIPHPGYRE